MDTGRELKCMLLNERSQAEKATYCVIPTKRNWKRHYNNQWVPGVWSEEESVGVLNSWGKGGFGTVELFCVLLLCGHRS